MSIISKVRNRAILYTSLVTAKMFKKTEIRENIAHSPIFIIGPPRCGSTIVYQYITASIDCLYVSNFVCRFYRNLYIGFRLQQFFLGKKRHNNFHSEYGNTESGGLLAPSECGSFWYQYLPKYKHHILAKEVLEESKLHLFSEIASISNKFDKPIVFKNLNAGMRIDLILDVFPNARFIFIKRNPFDISKSILKGKLKIQGENVQNWWSIMPPNVEELRKMDYISQIAAQIYYIEKEIEERLKEYHNAITIEYEQFITSPQEQLERVKKKFHLKALKNKVPSLVLTRSKKVSDDLYSDEQQLELKKAVGKYYDENGNRKV